MIDKQAGNLEIDVFSGGKYAVTMNGKSSERKNRLVVNEMMLYFTKK